jgi:hypothetical protein
VTGVPLLKAYMSRVGGSQASRDDLVSAVTGTCQYLGKFLGEFVPQGWPWPLRQYGLWLEERPAGASPTPRHDIGAQPN